MARMKDSAASTSRSSDTWWPLRPSKSQHAAQPVRLLPSARHFRTHHTRLQQPGVAGRRAVRYDITFNAEKSRWYLDASWTITPLAVTA